MDDPILNRLYQPLVTRTGIDPMAAARLAIEAFVPFKLFTCWLEWQARPDLVALSLSLAFLYVARTRFWPLARQGMRAVASPLGVVHMLFRVTTVFCVAAQALALLWPLVTGRPSAFTAMRVTNALSYLMLMSAIYLPMCEPPPPRTRRSRLARA